MLSFSPTGKVEVKIARITFLKKAESWAFFSQRSIKTPLPSFRFQNNFNPCKTAIKRRNTSDQIKHSIRTELVCFIRTLHPFLRMVSPFCKMATPFRIKGVAILQITSSVLMQKIICLGQIHHLFRANRPCIYPKQMIRFNEKDSSAG